jgi:dihydroorotate dehydrogenase electron transfer subunit
LKQVYAKVISNVSITPNVFLMWLEAPEIASIVQPGQFVMVKCGGDNLLRRPFSINRVSDDKTKLALLLSTVGKGTQWLSEQKEGSLIDILGPLGNGYSIQSDSQNILLLAGGVGIAPLYFLAQEAIRRECSVILTQGASKAAHLYPKTLPTGLELVTLTEDGSAGKKGMVTDLIPEYIDWADQIFACGPSPMYRTMAKMPQLKDRPMQISLEVRMGCGFGVCYGCTVKTKQGLKQVCQDGPIFELNDIIWDEFVDI